MVDFLIKKKKKKKKKKINLTNLNKLSRKILLKGN